jgi:predicted metal-dependent hydrolase
MNATSESTARVPVPRSPELALDGSIPRHWFGGNAVEEIEHRAVAFDVRRTLLGPRAGSVP